MISLALLMLLMVSDSSARQYTQLSAGNQCPVFVGDAELFGDFTITATKLGKSCGSTGKSSA